MFFLLFFFLLLYKRPLIKDSDNHTGAHRTGLSTVKVIHFLFCLRLLCNAMCSSSKGTIEITVVCAVSSGFFYELNVIQSTCYCLLTFIFGFKSFPLLKI